MLLRAPGATSFLLVTPSDRVGTDELRRRLSDLSSIEVTPKPNVIANDLNLYGGIFSGPIRLMVAIAFLVGTLVVDIIALWLPYSPFSAPLGFVPLPLNLLGLVLLITGLYVVATEIVKRMFYQRFRL